MTNQVGHIHRMQYYSVLKYELATMFQEDVKSWETGVCALREESQAEKAVCCMIPTK